MCSCCFFTVHLLVLVSRSEWFDSIQFAESHNGTLWQCLSIILQIDLNQCDEVVRVCRGRIGPRERCSGEEPGALGELDCLSAHDASASSSGCCQDSCGIGRQVSIPLFGGSSEGSVGPVWGDPSWHAVVNGARPPHDGEQGPGSFERHEGSSRVERQHPRVQRAALTSSVCSFFVVSNCLLP